MYSLDDNWVFAVSVLAHRVARRVAGVLAETSALNLSQWRVLAAVADRPGLSASEVVALTPMDKGLVSRAVKHLVEAGLIERRASDTDARRAHLHLSDKGRTEHARILKALRAAQATGERLPGAPDLNEALRAMTAAYDEKNWRT